MMCAYGILYTGSSGHVSPVQIWTLSAVSPGSSGGIVSLSSSIEASEGKK